MTSYILCCLLFTEFLLGSFHVSKSQSTTSEATASVSSMASTTSTFALASSSSSDNVTSSQTGIHNSSTTAANPTSSSSSTSSSPSETTKQPISSTTGTISITVPAHSSQNEHGVTTTMSDASPNTTVLSFTTTAAVNTSTTASSNGSSHTPTSVSVTTSSTITQTNSSATYSTVATSNNSSATTVSSTSHQTVSGSATTGVSYSTTAAINTTHSASTSTATANANFTAGQNTTTVGVVSSTVTSNSTLFTTESVTVETTSSSRSTVTSHITTDTVGSSSTDNYSTVGSAQATTPGGVPAWIAAPIVCGVLLIVVAIVLLLVLRRRRKKQRKSKFVSLERRQKEQPGGIMNPSFRIDSDDSERPPPAPVRVEDFVNHVAQLHRDSDYGFASEFVALNKMSPQNSKSAAELPENRTKNRFTNILPFDHSRVKLIPADDDENGGSDYINASFLPGFSSRREFIAAQGPMKSTVDDFWRMLWEYNVTTVVMVTNLFERGREKCVQYWPEQNEPVYYGDIQVELKSESSLNYYIIRVLNVTLEQKSRRVMHYQFLTWPDFGVPKEHSHLLSFLTQVRSSLHPTTNQPVLVHCSAGVGRTGTFILIDHVLQLIKRNSDIDLFGLVLDMRNYRSHMIQTEAQYIFAHECVRHAIELGYHEGRDIFTGSDDTSTGETQQESLYMNSGPGSN